MAVDVGNLSDHAELAGSRTRYVGTEDGYSVRTAGWSKLGTTGRGTFVILQGRDEAIEKYYGTIGELRRRGYNVVAFDWRGQGGSKPRLAGAAIPSARNAHNYLCDLDSVMNTLVKKHYAPPYCLFGNSFGGTMALCAAARPESDYEKLVVIAPFLGLDTYPLAAVSAFSSLMTGLGLGHRPVPEPKRTFGIQRNLPEGTPGGSGSGQRVGYSNSGKIDFANGAETIEPPTFGWVRAASRTAQNLMKNGSAEAITSPVMLVEAGQDKVVSNTAIRTFANALRSVDLVDIKNAEHDVLMDSSESLDLFWSAFDKFIQSDGPASSPRPIDKAGA